MKNQIAKIFADQSTQEKSTKTMLMTGINLVFMTAGMMLMKDMYLQAMIALVIGVMLAQFREMVIEYFKHQRNGSKK